MDMFLVSLLSQSLFDSVLRVDFKTSCQQLRHDLDEQSHVLDQWHVLYSCICWLRLHVFSTVTKADFKGENDLREIIFV